MHVSPHKPSPAAGDGSGEGDGSGDDGNDACCGDGCPTHRNLEETLKSVPCKNSEGKCVNPKTQACYDYICAGPVDPKTSKCPSFTNVCPCGTNYTDDTKDDGSKACCGIGCPTHRNLNFLRGATVATE